MQDQSYRYSYPPVEGQASSSSFVPPQQNMDGRYRPDQGRHGSNPPPMGYPHQEHNRYPPTHLPPPPFPPIDNHNTDYSGHRHSFYGQNLPSQGNNFSNPPPLPPHGHFPPRDMSYNDNYMTGERPDFARPPPAMAPSIQRQGISNQSMHEPSQSTSNRFLRLGDDNDRASGESGERRDTGKEDSKETEQDWVNKWLQDNKINHRLKEKKAVSASVSIPEARMLFREAMQISENLQVAQKELHSNVENTEEVWQKLWSNIKTQKERLEEIKRTLDEPTVKALSLKIVKIQTKRDRLKKCSTRAYQEKRERRERLHREIDDRLAQIWKLDQEKKRDREIKKAADETLAEVRKKINEAQKSVDLIKALTKLRQLRSDAAERKGLFVPNDIVTKFEEKTKVLSAMLEEQLQIYEAEKRTLEALLEQEAEENREREIAARKRQIAELEKRKEKTIKRLLFGKEGRFEDDDPMIPFREFYDAAQSNVEALIQIRREWDLYLVPPGTGGSRIPEGWVLPREPSSTDWASALKV